MIVSDKHIHGIQEALEKRVDYMLVFEDDAIFKNNSIDKFIKFINNLSINDTGLYVDLAGGCTKNDLKVDKLQFKQDQDFIYYLKPITNTACSYFVNKKQLQYFQYYLIRNPGLRNIGIDWMFNQIFIFQEKDKIPTKCAHAYPHIYDHGSTTGKYNPWLRL